MSLYFFHIRNGRDAPDEIGTDLPDLAAVRKAAVIAAAEALQDLGAEFWDSKSDWQLYVTDADRKHILSVNFSGLVAADA